MAKLQRAIDAFGALPHFAQQRRVALVDALLCVLASWLALALRLGFLVVPPLHTVLISVSSLLAWFAIAWARGIYESVLRYTGARTMLDLTVVGFFMAVALTVVVVTLQVDGLPRTVAVLQPIVFVALAGGLRLFIRFVLVDIADRDARRKQTRVLIYGARRAGQQLALSLRHEGHVRVVGYLDDDRKIAGQRLDGLRVYPADETARLIDKFGIDEILLAMPRISRKRRAEIIEDIIKRRPITVRALPSTAKILDGHVSVNDLRAISIEDLLGRDAVPADRELLDQNIVGKKVLVTGAGGSIGSQLCREIIQHDPASLILVELSEFALYRIREELRSEVDPSRLRLIDELADVADQNAAARLFQKHKPDTVFHAAAYKHVPIVERNVAAGVRNNVFGTLNCCIEAERAGVDTFILVSTDKAVRPTNVMGASKRIAELILQARAGTGSATRFTMVRFGNVLGSSGSVVPLFQNQIAAGGPITLTDKNVTRYFMTIPEASQLVVQAGALAEGGDVFVLDMGNPVKIYDLARRMVELTGLSVRDEHNPDGDVEIVEVGLREGEKKFEELLIGENPLATRHPRIIKAHEDYLDWADLHPKLADLREMTAAFDEAGIRRVLRDLVPGFKPEH